MFLGLVFYVGSKYTEWYGERPQDIYIAIFVLFSTVMGSGTSIANVPSVSKAKASAGEIFAIIDEKSTLDVRLAAKAPLQEVKEGSIEFREVTFRYPSRSTVVLNRMSFQVPTNTKIALVGASGCGKTTITNLLLRFYDIESGTICIGGASIKDYNVKRLRQEIGYVMQEPLLLNQTIRDNIVYGHPDATDFEVRKAALLANALSFIEQDIEDLEKDERIRKMRTDTESRLAVLQKKFSGLQELIDCLRGAD